MSNLVNLNPPQHRAITLGLCNQKGGVGKSTSVAALAAIYAKKGYRVLVVDNDPQGNVSLQLGVDLGRGLDIVAISNGSVHPGSIAGMYSGKSNIFDLIVSTNTPDIHLIPSTVDLSVVEMQLPGMGASDLRLRSGLEPVLTKYDIVLLDSPPNLGKLAINVLTTADYYITPVGDAWALRSVAMLKQVAETNANAYRLSCQFAGLFMTMTERTVIAQHTRQAAKQLYPDLLFSNEIRKSTVAREAIVSSLPIPIYDPNSGITADYRALAEEIAGRIGLQAPPVTTVAKASGE